MRKTRILGVRRLKQDIRLNDVSDIFYHIEKKTSKEKNRFMFQKLRRLKLRKIFRHRIQMEIKIQSVFVYLFDIALRSKVAEIGVSRGWVFERKIS